MRIEHGNGQELYMHIVPASVLRRDSRCRSAWLSPTWDILAEQQVVIYILKPMRKASIQIQVHLWDDFQTADQKRKCLVGSWLQEDLSFTIEYE